MFSNIQLFIGFWNISFFVFFLFQFVRLVRNTHYVWRNGEAKHQLSSYVALSRLYCLGLLIYFSVYYLLVFGLQTIYRQYPDTSDIVSAIILIMCLTVGAVGSLEARHRPQQALRFLRVSSIALLVVMELFGFIDLILIFDARGYNLSQLIGGIAIIVVVPSILASGIEMCRFLLKCSYEEEQA